MNRFTLSFPGSTQFLTFGKLENFEITTSATDFAWHTAELPLTRIHALGAGGSREGREAGVIAYTKALGTTSSTKTNRECLD